MIQCNMHGHTQPTVDSLNLKVKESRFQNTLHETVSKYFPFVDPKWHLAIYS